MAKDKQKVWLVGLLMVASVLFGCSSLGIFGSLPKEVSDIAVGHWKDNCDRFEDSECKNFEVTCSEKKEVSSADKANGIEGRYCVAVSFIFKDDDSDEWEDNRVRPLLIEKSNGKWENIEQLGLRCQCSN